MLIVSNSPETTSTTGLLNLYAATIPLSAGSHDFRYYCWHFNNSGGALNIALQMRLSTGTGTVGSLHRSIGAGPLNPAIGMCLAKSQLGGTFDPGPDPGASLTATSNARVSDLISGANNRVLGGIVEGTITLDQNADLYVWVQSSSGTAWGGYHGTIDPVTDNHVRGWWPSCKAIVLCSSFDAKPSAVPFQDVSVCAGGGPEEMAFAQTTGDANGVANRGRYGVDLEYRIPIANSDAAASPLWVYAAGRNTGHPAFGAVKMSSSPTNSRIGLAPIGYSAGPPASSDVAPLSCDSSGNSVAISVPPGGLSSPLAVTVATGGAAQLPFSLVLGRISMMPAGGAEN